MVRFALETLRQDNWTFFGVPTAQIVSLLFIVPALVVLAWRHRPQHPEDDPPSRPAGTTWGALGRAAEEPPVAEPAEPGPDTARSPASGHATERDEDEPVDVLT